MIFKVTKQYGSNRELDSGQFKDLAAARSHVAEKIREEISLKIKVIYRIYEWDDLIEEVNSDNVLVEDGGRSQNQGATFSPTPLNSAPRPPGVPHNWVKDEDGNKKKE